MQFVIEKCLKKLNNLNKENSKIIKRKFKNYQKKIQKLSKENSKIIIRKFKNYQKKIQK